jgi:hypothetical protein
MPEKRPRQALALALLTALAWGCGGLKSPPAGIEPPADYQRRLLLIVERADFRPAAGVPLTIKPGPQTRLVSPAGGRRLTAARGRLDLVFAPVPQPLEPARAGGDVIVDYPVQAVLTFAGGRQAAIDDRETFARYQDESYQGLNRDPEVNPSYYMITLPYCHS